MKRIVRITPHFAVTGALEPADFEAAAALGFRSIISNLPDGELAATQRPRGKRELAADAGLGFRHIPVTKAEAFSERVVGGTTDGAR